MLNVIGGEAVEEKPRMKRLPLRMLQASLYEATSLSCGTLVQLVQQLLASRTSTMCITL